MQKTDALLSRHGDAAFLIAVQIVHVNVPVNQLQQRGLAAAVPSHHSNLLIVPNLEIHVFQYSVRAVLHQRVSNLISHDLVLSSPSRRLLCPGHYPQILICALQAPLSETTPRDIQPCSIDPFVRDSACGCFYRHKKPQRTGCGFFMRHFILFRLYSTLNAFQQYTVESIPDERCHMLSSFPALRPLPALNKFIVPYPLKTRNRKMRKFVSRKPLKRQINLDGKGAIVYNFVQ